MDEVNRDNMQTENHPKSVTAPRRSWRQNNFRWRGGRGRGPGRGGRARGRGHGHGRGGRGRGGYYGSGRGWGQFPFATNNTIIYGTVNHYHYNTQDSQPTASSSHQPQANIKHPPPKTRNPNNIDTFIPYQIDNINEKPTVPQKKGEKKEETIKSIKQKKE